MKVGFLVEVLSREAQRLLEGAQARGIVVAGVDAEGLELVPAPDGSGGLVGNEPLVLR